MARPGILPHDLDRSDGADRDNRQIGPRERMEAMGKIGPTERTETMGKIGPRERTEAMGKIGPRERMEAMGKIGPTERTATIGKSVRRSGPRPWLPDLQPLGLRLVQGIARFQLKCLLERRNVGHRTVGAK
jgi:hypothetical protein